MNSVVFDTYKIVAMLKKRGFSEEQATGLVEALQQMDLSHVATKGDVQELKSALREMELRITIKLGGLLIAGVGVLATMNYFA